MAMTDSHRTFVQFFLAKGVLGKAEVKALFKFSLKKYGRNCQDENIPDFVTLINDHIKPIHMEIKKGVCELEGKHYYVLVNKAENEVTLASSMFQAHELDFFRKLLSLIVHNGSAGATEAVNLVTKGDKLSKNEAEELLERFKADKWLNQSKGRFYLSVRSLAELDHLIEEQYPDQANKCNMCKKLVVHGLSCQDCDTKMHIYCAQRWFGDNERLCPEKRCKAPWTQDIPEKE